MRLKRGEHSPPSNAAADFFAACPPGPRKGEGHAKPVGLAASCCCGARACSRRAGGVGGRAAEDRRRLRLLQSGRPPHEGPGLARAGVRRRQDQDRMGAQRRQQQGARIPQRRQHRFRLLGGLGGVARQGERQSDQGDLHLFEAGMDGARRAQGLADRHGRRSQGQARRCDTRHRSRHLPAARAAQCRAEAERRQDRDLAASGRQDGAGARRCRCVGRSRPVHGADRARAGLAPVLPRRQPQHLRFPQRARGIRRAASRRRAARPHGL